MPISFTATPAPGTGYADIRVGGSHNIHQAPIAAAVTADAQGYFMPGTPLQADGTAISAGSQVAKFVVGPEAVRKAATGATQGNTFLDGAISQDMIEDNLGRVLNANEIAALAAGGFKLV